MNTILLVDDDEAILDVLQIILRDEGYGCLAALESEKALALARAIKFQLIIVDLMMYPLDGVELVAEIRKLPHLYKTPIIMISAHNDGERRSKECNCQFYLPKPFDISDLIRAVNKFI